MEKTKGRRMGATFSVDKETYKKFKQAAAKENMNMSEMIELFMIQKVRQNVDPSIRPERIEFLTGKAARM
jgi:hypothetical protein